MARPRIQPAQWPSINPGQLRNYLQIQQPVNSADARGQSISPASWTVVLSTWAAIFTAGGRETSQAAQIVSEVSHVVRIRYAAVDIKAGYQVLFNDRIFVVKYVENVEERDVLLNLYCLEVDQGGGQL